MAVHIVTTINMTQILSQTMVLFVLFHRFKYVVHIFRNTVGLIARPTLAVTTNHIIDRNLAINDHSCMH